MILNVKPVSKLKGRVSLPASKSYSIRAFIVASCGGRSSIINPSDSDDVMVAVRVAKLLGTRISRHKNNTWQTAASSHRKKLAKVNVGESGTVLRFVLPLLALQGQKAKVVGQGTLRGRPNLFLTRTLRKMGCAIKGQGPKESIPIYIREGGLSGGKIEIDGTLSSQFISALLIACPQLKENSSLILKGKGLVSLDYITMTLEVLRKSGIRIVQKSKRRFTIKGNQKFKGLKNFTVPADYGLGAFLMAAAVLTKSNVTLAGSLSADLIQADGQILPLLKKMGAKFVKTSKMIKLKGPFLLKGGQFSLKDCPDLVPIMAVLALFAKGKTRLYNIGHARAKESDRISDLRTELLKVGAKITEKRDELVIYPQKQYRQNQYLDPHRDHRLAMSFSVLGLKLGARVKDIECCRKSYPGFVKDFKSIGAKISRS